MTIQLNTKYRIIKTTYGNFKIQYKHWFWPFWFEADLSYDTSLEGAKVTLKAYRNSGTVVHEE